tara:strand:- start:250 stop:1788 length:1539 start_codon:yes stop_codon:yes gene_type:complete
MNLRRFDLTKFFKNSKFNRYSIKRVYKNFIFLCHTILKTFRQKFYKYYKTSILYLTGITVVSIIIYLIVPFFFNYNKSNIENIICEDLKIKCNIKGKIYYNFIPFPKLVVSDLQIKNFSKEKEVLGSVQEVQVNLPLKSLLKKTKKDLYKIRLIKPKLFFNYENFQQYEKIFLDKKRSKVISIKKGSVDFFNGSKFITSINNINGKYKYKIDNEEVNIKGIFLGDEIQIDFESDLNLEKNLKIKLKKLNFLTKLNFIKSTKEKNVISGNLLLRKNKNRITSFFDLKKDKIIIKQGNLRNSFSDGTFNGKIKFKPFFDFELDLNLKSLNFYTLSKSIRDLDEKSKKNLFLINKKINGKFNLSADKMFSKKTFVNSFESQIQFINGDILINQLLLSLGKLGAADLNGVIKNEKNFSNLTFNSNLFIDNPKRFYNKFGVYNKGTNPFDLFVSGSFDLKNLKMRFNELSNSTKLTNEDITYIENEFNDLLLIDGYKSLFDFSSLRKFVRQISIQEK